MKVGTKVKIVGDTRKAFGGVLEWGTPIGLTGTVLELEADTDGLMDARVRLDDVEITMSEYGRWFTLANLEEI